MLYLTMANRRLLKLWQYLRPHWRPTLVGIVSLFLVNALGVYIPLLIRDATDDLGKVFSFDKVEHYVILILVLTSLMWVIRMLSRLALFGVGRQVEYELKQGIFDHLLKLEPAYFSVNTPGDLMNRSTSDVEYS
jgi:ATP-binding cassette, subfamily B, multidrug efflux pump